MYICMYAYIYANNGNTGGIMVISKENRINENFFSLKKFFEVQCWIELIGLQSEVKGTTHSSIQSLHNIYE